MDRHKKAGPDDGQPAPNTSSNQQLENSTFRDTALAYAKRGWPVMALHTIRNGHCTCGDRNCGSPGKHPYTKHGVKDASLDCVAFIQWWWWSLPDANLGVATGGESRLIVVDIDPSHGGIDSLARIEREHGVTPTFSVRTGSGGRHDYYRLPLGVRIGGPKSGWPGIDIRGDGDYVVAPPSLHASGNRYEVIDNRPVAPAPAWLLEALNASRSQHLAEQDLGSGNDAQRTVPASAESSLGAIPPAVMRAADDAPKFNRERNVYHKEAEVLVREFANHWNPPLPQTEATHARNHAWKHASGFQDTDVANAARLIYQHGQNIRYAADMQQWFVWNDKWWQRDTDQIDIERFAIDTARSIYGEAQAEKNEDQRKRLATWARLSESKARIKDMITLARNAPGVTINSRVLDANPMLLGVQNGTLDLRTGKLRPPEREDYITKVAPVAFNPDAKCPRWHQFWGETMNGNREMISFIQRMTGYTLTGHTTEQCLFILFGRGASGKSIFTSTMQSLLGGYACTTLAESFMVRRYQGAPMAELARLAGRRLVLASEPEDGAQLAESLVKQMTGGDMIVGRFLYRDAFEFPPTVKPYLITNHQPIIKGDDHAIWRRIHLVPFEVTIPEKQRDPKLKDKLLAELPGILNWALEGCLAWQKSKGLNPPPRVVEATRAYRSDMDWFRDWLAECCDTGSAGAVTPSQQLHASYEQWAKHYGLAPMSRNAFGRRLQERGFERLHTRRGSVFRGIEVRPAAPPTPQTPKQAKSIGAHMITKEDEQENNVGDELGDNSRLRAH